jgi:elongation factor Ts
VDLEADRVAAVAKIGENIRITRSERIEVKGNGLVAAYIHTGAKVGVLVEVGAGKEATVGREEFKQLVRDITLQIAAAQPHAVRREEIPADILNKEKEIAAEQFKDKPPQAVAKIVEGKLEKFYQTWCLVDQAFVKNGDLTMSAHIAGVGKALGDSLEVRRFVRFQVGEALPA